MTLANRIKFFIGIFMVVLVAVTLFIYLDFSMSRVSSIKAQIQSDTYTVGIDYSGIVEKQFIDEGAYIKVNDPLFELRSPTLSSAIRNNEVAKESLLYAVTDQGTVLISAAANGRVETINYRQGAFTPANSGIAIVNEENGYYINAQYKLSSPDYARLNNQSKLRVTMPDNTTVNATVYAISLSTVDEEVITTVRARINQNQINSDAFTVGTPVSTVLSLDTKTWYSNIVGFVQSLFRPTSASS